MKNKSLIALLIVVLLAGYYLLGTGYMQRLKQHDRLNAHIAAAVRALAEMPEVTEDTEERLTTARANLNAAKVAFPATVNTTSVVNAILNLSEDVGVKTIPLLTQPLSAEKNGEHDYHVFRMNLSVSGSFSKVKSFIDRLENGMFPTLILEHLSATAPDMQTAAENTADLMLPVTVSIDLAIYTSPAKTD